MQFSVLTDDNWLLTVGTFLPLVGVLIMLFIPAAEETLHKQIAIVTSGRPAVTVNTCTADHPRALPAYVSAGFQRLRTVREVWPVPTRLGLTIPPHLMR